MTRNDDPSSPDDLTVPPKLAQAIHARYSPDIVVPAEINRLIVNQARANLARRRRLRWWAMGGSAIAAVAVVAVVLLRPPLPRSVPSVASGPGDINGDGRIDMLDAYLLAKHIKDGDRLDPRWDMNGDGVIVQRDIDAIAAIAVSLGKGGVR